MVITTFRTKYHIMKIIQTTFFDENWEPITQETDASKENEDVGTAIQTILASKRAKKKKEVSISTFDETVRKRSRKRHLSVTFPDGTTICRINATITYLEVLQHIGPEKVATAGIDVSKYPLVMREVPDRLKEWCKPLENGWYVNMQGSDASVKYRQLSIISERLNLGLKIEMGTNLYKDDENKEKDVMPKTRMAKKNFMVKFPDGSSIECSNPFQTFVEAIRKLGVDTLQRKGIEIAGKSLITVSKRYNGQVEIGKNQWLFVPFLTKQKMMWLQSIGSLMHYRIETSYSEKNNP